MRLRSFAFVVNAFWPPDDLQPYYYYYYYVLRNYHCTMRLTILLQSVLFRVSSTSLFKVFVAFDRSSLIPILLRSCCIVCINAVFGLPCGLLTFLRYSSKAFLAGVSGYSFIICPNHFNRLIFICLVQGSHFVLVYSSWLVIFLCHLIPRILRKCLRWKVSMLFLSFFVRVHNSLLYRKTLFT